MAENVTGGTSCPAGLSRCRLESDAAGTPLAAPKHGVIGPMNKRIEIVVQGAPAAAPAAEATPTTTTTTAIVH